MRKEFGKWLMDIAKYIVTAVIISSMFGEMDSTTVYIVGALAVFGALGCGLFLVSDKVIKLKKLNLRILRRALRIRRIRRRNNNLQTN